MCSLSTDPVLVSCLWRYLTEIGCTLHTRWKQQFPSNYCARWEQIVVVFSPRLGLTASVSLSCHWHYLEDVGFLQDDQTEALVWGFCLSVYFFCFSVFFSCFDLFVCFYCCWRKILPQPLVSICYWRCTTCTCEITGRRQSLFLLKQLLIFIQKTQRKIVSHVHMWKLRHLLNPNSRYLYRALYFVIRCILVTGTECTDMCMYFMLTVSHLFYS